MSNLTIIITSKNIELYYFISVLAQKDYFEELYILERNQRNIQLMDIQNLQQRRKKPQIYLNHITGKENYYMDQILI